MTLFSMRAAVVPGVLLLASVALAQEAPPAPRIASVVPLKTQPIEKDPALIWFDDFDGPEKIYAEGESPLDKAESFGGRGRSLLCFYEKGKRGRGGRKVFFGDSPAYTRKAARRGETFTDVYWRIYVKHQPGWRGSPAKMSRATSLASPQWTQAMIAHVWSGKGEGLTLDPVRGVVGDRVVTRKYNDFEKMKWLGNRPASRFPIHATEESGAWVCVESRAKLNTPGKADGLNQLWIDGRLECERKNLDFRGRYTGHGINAVFLEAYWNQGSPVTQSRWYDRFVIATKPIGPAVCPTRPALIKRPYTGAGEPGPWAFEVGVGFDGADVVYRSKALSPNAQPQIDASHGAFVGRLKGKDALTPGPTYFIRARQQSAAGVWSAWSRWHQGFRVAEETP